MILDDAGTVPRGDGAAAYVQRTVDTHFDASVAYWDEVYRRLDLDGSIYQRRQATVLQFVDAAGLPAGARILEVGCGAGHLTLRLAERDLQVQAVDSSPAMVELTGSRAAGSGARYGVGVALADAHALPFASCSFGLVAAIGVIPWLHSPAAAIVEMARVLRPGGQLVLSADNAARLGSFIDPRAALALTPLRRVYHAVRKRPEQAFSHLHSPRRIDRLLRSAGLQPLQRTTVGFGPIAIGGRTIFADERAMRIDGRLQRWADAGVPLLKRAGWNYLVRAVKTGAESDGARPLRRVG